MERTKRTGASASGVWRAAAVPLLLVLFGGGFGRAAAETVTFENGSFPPGFSWRVENGSCSIVPKADLPAWSGCGVYLANLSGRVLSCRFDPGAGQKGLVRFNLGGRAARNASVRVFSPDQNGSCGSSVNPLPGRTHVQFWLPFCNPVDERSCFHTWDGEKGEWNPKAHSSWADGFPIREAGPWTAVSVHGGNADHPVAIIDDVVFTPVIPPAVRVLTPPLTSLAKGQPIEWWAERDPLHGFYVSLSSPTRQSFDSYVASPDLTGARVIHSGLGVYLYFVRPTARRIDLVKDLPTWANGVRFTVFAADVDFDPVGVSEILASDPSLVPTSSLTSTRSAGSTTWEMPIRYRNPGLLAPFLTLSVEPPAELVPRPPYVGGAIRVEPGAEAEVRLRYPASALASPGQIVTTVTQRKSGAYGDYEVGRNQVTVNVVGPTIAAAEPPAPAVSTLRISTESGGTETPVAISLKAGASLEVAPVFSDPEAALLASSVARADGTLEATARVRPSSGVAGRQVFELRSPGAVGFSHLELSWISRDALVDKPVDECRFRETIAVVPSAVSAAGLAGARFTTDGWVANTGATSAEVALVFSPDGRAERCLAFPLAARASVRITDIVGTLFASQGAGLLEVRSTQPLSTRASVLVRSETDGKPAERFGGNVPAAAIGALDPVLVPGVEDSMSFRTNLVLAETEGAACMVLVEALSEAGAVTGAREIELAPRQRLQINSVVEALTGGLASATLRLRHLRGDGKASGLVSVIEDLSNSFGLASGTVPVAGRPLHVAGGARLEGGGSTRYETDLYIAAGPAAASADVRYHYVDPSGARRAETRTISLPAHGALPTTVSRDVIRSLFGLAEPTYGWFSVTPLQGALSVRAVLRTVVDPSDLSRGFRVASLPVVSEAAPAVARTVGVERSPQIRTNAALINTDRAAVEVRLSLWDSKGLLKGTRSRSVPPGDYVQLTDLASVLGLGTETIQDGVFEVETVSGSVGGLLATLSRIDNTSRNPEVVLLR